MNLVIAGGSGGIGSAFVEALAKRPAVKRIIATCHRNPSTLDHPKVTWQRLDLTDEAAVRDWAQGTGEIDWLINAAGRLHTPAKGPEKSIRQICARGAGGQPAQQQAPGVGDEGGAWQGRQTQSIH